MNKKILLFSLLAITLFGVVFKTMVSNDTEVEKLRKQHAQFLKEHPYQKTGNLPKKERKAQGLPPNAFFEQKYLSEINPATGKTHKENVFKLQNELKALRAGQKVPGEADNAWEERGPDNVGGRTRALLFDPNDATSETVFAGGVSGGLWKNTKISDASNKWVRVGIPENLAVSCIVADPNDSKTFYIGTGESYVSGDVNGDGVWKSTDGGNSWTNILGGVTGAAYLDANSTVKVNSPASIADTYISTLATAFGGDLLTPVTGNLVLVQDDTAPESDACTDLVNSVDISGNIAVIKRGVCSFDDKVKRAQDAGAIAVVMINNVDGNPIAMGGDDASITIPAVMIGKTNGEAVIIELLSGAVNVTLTKGSNNATNALVVPGIQHVNDIIIRDNGGISEVFVAAGESGYPGATVLGGDSFGVYKSTNGIDFVKLDIPKTTAGNEHEPNNLEIASDNSIYLSTTRSFAHGDGGGVIFKSTDGINFNLKHTIPNGVRTEIAVSPSTPGLVYILSQTSTSGAPVKIFKTINDFGTTAELGLPNDADNGIPDNDFTRGQSFYDLLIKVDPTNENSVYVGGIDLFKSTNGGVSWKQISKWSNNNNLSDLGVSLVHADQHGLAFASSEKMVFGNDGGVYYSSNSGKNILARNKNYNTLQFYTVGVAPSTAFGGDEYFLAGAQDNGTLLIANASMGINSSISAAGGDGAASFFDVDGIDKYYITNYVYNGSIRLYNYNTFQHITINSEEGSNGSFINEEELDSHLNILYSNYSSGSNYIIKRYSNLLSTISKVNLTNGLMDRAPSVLKVSPYTVSSSKLFIGLGNGKLLRVDNANVDQGTWTDITGDSFVGSVSDIEFGATENDIFVTMHNYGVKSIWYSNDAGVTWKSKEGNLPDIPVKSILQNPLSLDEVIIGTDLGVWKTANFSDENPTWEQSYNGMSNVPVLDLDLRDDNTVFAATYGRGVFSGKFIFDPNGDDDGDTILNGVDNCPTNANTDQKDTDGDGIGDVCDNCPTMANVDQKDTNGNGSGDVCDTSYKDQENIKIQTVSETCIGEKDGKITVTVKQVYVAYKITITGVTTETKNIAIGGTTVTFDGLDPAEYEVCIEIMDKNYTQCFETKIVEAATISLRAAKNQQSKDYTFNVTSGTAPYNVYLNGNLIETFNQSTFNVKIEGSGVLEVKTAKSCEGEFKMVLDNIFLKTNPVTDTIELLVPNNADASIDVMVFDVTGKVVVKDNIQRQGNSLSIPFSNVKSGIYILKLGTDNTNTFKILK